jgi:hypothetical protein
MLSAGLVLLLVDTIGRTYFLKSIQVRFNWDCGRRTEPVWKVPKIKLTVALRRKMIGKEHVLLILPPVCNGSASAIFFVSPICCLLPDLTRRSSRWFEDYHVDMDVFKMNSIQRIKKILPDVKFLSNLSNFGQCWARVPPTPIEIRIAGKSKSEMKPMPKETHRKNWIKLTIWDIQIAQCQNIQRWTFTVLELDAAQLGIDMNDIRVPWLLPLLRPNIPKEYLGTDEKLDSPITFRFPCL